MEAPHHLAGTRGGLEEQRLRALACTTLAIVWTADADGTLRADNPSWTTFTGTGPETSDALEAVHVEDRERVSNAWQQAVEQAHGFAVEFRLRRHDGQWREMACEAAPVFDGDGQLAEWVGYCIDVTERRRAEEALREREAHLRLLDRIGTATRSMTDATEVMAITARLLGEHLNATRTAYADVEADSDRFHIRADWSLPGVLSSAGTYSLTLFGPQAVSNLRQGIDLVVRDVDRELGDEGGARMFNAIGIKAVICAGLVKEGRLVAMMAVHQAEPRDWSRDEIAIVGEVVERCWAHIERVRDTAKLREQDRHKDEFLATLAHELRNPLAPLRYASAILRTAPGTRQAQGAQDVIERQIGHMARLVDDLLDLSRVNRGLITLQPRRVPLRGLMEQAVEAARPALEGARHRLEVRLPDHELSIDVDPARIVQAIGNLLNNAAKYTPDGGQVRLSAWRDGDKAIIEVTDNGIGIPPEQQGRLFQMFTQLRHTVARAQGGLGIGLALVKKLMELHGGGVRVFSKGLDEGTTFTLELPLEPAPAAATVDLPGAAAPPSRDERVRVLVVEDNPDGLTTLVTLLEIMGYAATGAANGESALQISRHFDPDIALLDLGLPDMDGVEVGRRLLSDHPEVKLIAVTGWGATGDRARTKAAGFQAHLTKPVEPATLREAIGRAHTSKAPSD